MLVKFTLGIDNVCTREEIFDFDDNISEEEIMELHCDWIDRNLVCDYTILEEK